MFDDKKEKVIHQVTVPDNTFAIFCNYDGVKKHITKIEDDAFIGSNSALVAPLTIGSKSYVGSGSVVTKNVGKGQLAIARGRQKNMPNRKK